MSPDDDLNDDACNETDRAPVRTGCLPETRGLSGKSARIARHSRLLAGFPEDVCSRLLSGAAVRIFGRGETIFLQNEPVRHVFVVLDGWVKLNRLTESGTEAVIAVFAAGQSFGEAVAFQDRPSPVNAEAVTDCRLLRLEAGAFIDMLRTEPDCVGPVLSAMYHQLHSMILQIEALKARTGSQRVATFLLELCNGETGAAEVVLPHDKMLVAGRLGMKPESLSRAFSRLRRDAGVEIRGNLARIPSIPALRRFSVRDPALAWSKSG